MTHPNKNKISCEPNKTPQRSPTEQERFKKLNEEFQETRDKLADIESLTENQTKAAWRKIDDLYDKLNALSTEILRNENLPIKKRKKSFHQVMEIVMYIYTLRDGIRTEAEKHGIFLEDTPRMIMAELSSEEGKNPDKKWAQDFAKLNYSDQATVLQRRLDLRKSPMAPFDPSFFEELQAQHKKQKNNPKFNWVDFIEYMNDRV